MVYGFACSLAIFLKKTYSKCVVEHFSSQEMAYFLPFEPISIFYQIVIEHTFVLCNTDCMNHFTFNV